MKTPYKYLALGGTFVVVAAGVLLLSSQPARSDNPTVCCEYYDAGAIHHERCKADTCAQFGGHAVDDSKCN